VNRLTAIRAATLRILEKEGPEAVSMRRVARAASITPMAIYHYFPSRKALLDSVTHQEFAEFGAALAGQQATGSLEERLERNLDRFLDFALKRPRVFDYVFSQPRPGARRFPRDFAAGESPTFSVLAAMVAEGIRSGYFREGDPMEIALTLAAHTQGLVTLYRGARFSMSEKEFRALCKRSGKRVLDGLKRPGA
jgi:AcrR family transcriptional regulator